MYGAILADVGSNITMRVDDRMIRLIIGKGGSTIQNIQSASGAHINIKDNGTVSIRGTRDSVEAARKMVEDVAHREEVKIAFDGHLLNALTAKPAAAAAAAVAEGGKSPKAEKEGASLLDKIREATQCDQISAIRSESKIVVRGKRDAVAEARRAIDELLRELRPEIATVAFDDVLFNFLTRRASDRTNALDRLRAPIAGLMALDADRRTMVVTAAGSKEACAEAVTQVHALLADLAGKTRKVAVPQSALGAIIGPQGSTISELQRAHKCDININKETNDVQLFSAAGGDAALDAAEAAVKALAGVDV
jgi:rRNA processing protein Krr1/Pno1